MSAADPTHPVTTVVSTPRHRLFRHLTHGERLATFAWRWAYRLLFRFSPLSADFWRRAVLRCFGARIHPTATIHRSVWVIQPWNLTLGKKVIIRHHVILDCQAPIHINDGTCISQLSHLCTATHEYNDRHMPITTHPICIGRECWLAADVFVGCGVTVGDRTVLGARCSVFRDVPPDSVWVENPARDLRARRHRATT